MKLDVGQRKGSAAPTGGTVLNDKYLLGEVLGEGPFAWVFSAQHKSIDALRFAVKILKPFYSRQEEVAQRFMESSEAISSLHGRHAVRVYDAGTSDEGLLYMVMERIRGMPLSEVIANHDRLEPIAAGSLALGISRALVDAHEAGVIHGDLKPSDILVTQPSGDPHPIAKVVDFGLTRIIAGDSGKARSEDGGAERLVCAARYAAPEVIKGSPQVSSDLYSLGHILVEMLTGSTAYAKVPEAAVAGRQCEKAPVPLPAEVTDGVFGELVQRLLSKDPSGRPQSAALIIEDLEMACEDIASEVGTRRFRLDLGDSTPEEVAGESWTSDGYPVADVEEDEEFTPEETDASWASEGTPSAVFHDPRGEHSGPVEIIADNDPSEVFRLPVPTDVRLRAEAERARSKRRWLVPAVVLLLSIGGAAVWWITIGDTPNPQAQPEPEPTEAAGTGDAGAIEDGEGEGELVAEGTVPAVITPEDIDLAIRTAGQTVQRGTTPPAGHLISLFADTEGAAVFLGETFAGTLPMNNVYTGPQRPLRLRVVAEGYEDLHLTFARPGRIESWVALEPIAPEMPAETSTSRTERTSRQGEPAREASPQREAPAGSGTGSSPEASTPSEPAAREREQRREAESETRETERPAIQRHSDIRNPWGD